MSISVKKKLITKDERRGGATANFLKFVEVERIGKFNF